MPPRIVQVGANPIITPAPQASRGNLALSQALTNAAHRKQFTPGANGLLEGADVLGKAGTGALVQILGEKKAEERASRANQAIAQILAQKNEETATRDRGGVPLENIDDAALQGIAGAQARGTLPNDEAFFTPEQRPGRVEIGLAQDTSNLGDADALTAQLGRTQAGRTPPMSIQAITQALNNGVPPQLLLQQGRPQVSPDTLARIASNERLAKLNREQGKSAVPPLSPERFNQNKQLAGIKANADFENKVNVARAVERIKNNSPRGQAELEIKKLKLDEAIKEKQQSEEKKVLAKEASQVKNSLLTGKVEKAIELVNKWGTTGFMGAVMRLKPGSDAVDLSSTLDTIKANLGFDELTAMRAASKTGGALGSIAVRELELLTATRENLDQDQSKGQLLENLQNLQQGLLRWKKAFDAAANERLGQQGNTNALGLRAIAEKERIERRKRLGLE